MSDKILQTTHNNCQICGKSCNPAFCLCLDCTYRNGGILQETEREEEDLVDIFEDVSHNKKVGYMLNLMQIQKS